MTRAYTKYAGVLGKPARKFRAYASYASMLSRCFNKKDKEYSYYGGRGIEVCERWQESFVNFLQDMGDRPQGFRVSLDRINNNGNYEPGNCRWSNPKEQVRNRRNTLVVKWKGQDRFLFDLCQEYKIKQNVVWNRLKLGWELDKALTCPIIPCIRIRSA